MATHMDKHSDFLTDDELMRILNDSDFECEDIEDEVAQIAAINNQQDVDPQFRFQQRSHAQINLQAEPPIVAIQNAPDIPEPVQIEIRAAIPVPVTVNDSPSTSRERPVRRRTSEFRVSAPALPAVADPDPVVIPVAAHDLSSTSKERPMRWRASEFRDGVPALPLEESLETEISFPGIKESFFEYFNWEFWENAAEMTNLYSVQKRNLKSVNCTAKELIAFTGIEIMMGCLHLPQAKLYWSRDINITNISNHMTRNRYYELRNHLHFVNNLADRDLNDKLWKVRPILTAVRNQCLSLPRSTHLSIDEQMIPFAGRCQFLSYVPSKPNPLGLKNFVLAASDGLILDFKLYTGKGTIDDDLMKKLGLGAGIVSVLCETVPQNNAHVIYTDRFFSSVKCAETLLERNTFLTGTVMSNRTTGAISKLVEDKSLKRGEWSQVVRQDDKIVVTKWKDNKSVLLLSTCVGSHPVGTCTRWSKEEKAKIKVPQPAIVTMYNKNMGGIDLHDRLLSYYRSYIRTRKWPIRVFNHFVDVAIINCWLTYRRHCRQEAVPKNDQLSLLQYRLRLANIMILSSSAPKRQTLVEENESSEEEPVVRPKYRKIVPQALPEVKFDNIGHFPKFMTSDKFASKCRYAGCKSRCRVVCVKCKVYLCINNNCFLKYHTK